jgi:hypothetical protein
MGKSFMKLWGAGHKSAVDPLNVLPNSVTDPANIFNYGGEIAAPPPAASEPVMPDADSEAVAAARRRKVAAMKSRGGRASTILGGEDRLGG